MTKQEVNSQEYNCPICKGQNYENWLVCDDDQTLDSCRDCGLGYLTPYPTQIDDLYEDYGDHIVKLPASYFESRLKVGFKKSILFSLIKKVFGKDINLLDYGGGAGFFINAAQKCGIKNSYLFEPSKNFRRTAIEKVGIAENYVTEDLSELKVKFKFVSMLDVIEHLPQDKIHIYLKQLTTQMELGGYLFGETPNKRSLNLRMFGTKDPVICPPSHLLYFTKKSLDKLLKEHGFKKKILFTMGVSTNSFFRKDKFIPSFVEQPKSFVQKLFSFFINILFKLFSFLAAMMGTGYQIIFLYQLKDKKN